MTFKPTFEMYELTQRIGDGDLLAVKDLWPLIFDVPFDAKRPAEDIVKDLTDKMAELFPPEEPAKQEPVTELDYATAFLNELLVLVDVIKAPRAGRK